MERWITHYQSEEPSRTDNPMLTVAAALFATETPTRQPEDDTQPTSFEEWLGYEQGSQVLYRIAKNRHLFPIELSAAHFDTIDDVQQKALIWLWQTWQVDPGFHEADKQTTSPQHKIAYLTKRAVSRARCMYAKRRIEKRDNQVDLEHDEGDFFSRPYVPLKYILADSGTIRPTDLRDHDRPTLHTDKHADVQVAIEKVVQRMIADYSIAKGNYRRIPIEKITRTIIEGYMYHFTDRYNQTGDFRQFCEARGLGKNQIYKWRPIIFDYLREELQAYKPADPPTKIPKKQLVSGDSLVLKIRSTPQILKRTQYAYDPHFLKVRPSNVH